jgi:hypothetical protein
MLDNPPDWARTVSKVMAPKAINTEKKRMIRKSDLPKLDPDLVSMPLLQNANQDKKIWIEIDGSS